MSAAFGAVAVAAGLGDRRRRRRNDPDAVGWVDWPTVQMLALIALAVTAGLAFKA
ncbi:hypothetical protein [Sphingomonas sp. R86521]|uniref:hypothetical protein n=1 Tax=Sphingomonas sp. R86521 TaxID=3093860 RepID=UPI0036D425EF